MLRKPLNPMNSETHIPKPGSLEEEDLKKGPKIRWWIWILPVSIGGGIIWGALREWWASPR